MHQFSSTICFFMALFVGFIPSGEGFAQISKKSLDMQMMTVGSSDLQQCPSDAPVNLHLTHVLQRALRCSPELMEFQLNYQIAQADSMIASQRPNPVLGLGADSINPTPGRSPQGTRQIDSSVRIDQLVELGEKPRFRREAASAAELASQFSLKFAQKAVLSDVEHIYFDVLSAQQRAMDLAEMVQMNQRVLEVAQIRFKAGDISDLELKKIVLDITRANNEYQNAKTDLAKSKSNLAKILGYNQTLNQTTLARDWPNHEISIPAIPWERISQRADLRVLQNRTLSAEKSRYLARALRVPDVTVGLQYNHLPVTGSYELGTVNTYMLNLSVPLFLRHSYEGELRKAEIEYFKFRDEQLRGEKDAHTSLKYQEAELLANQERLTRVLKEILPTASQVAASAEFAYAKGAIGVLDLIDARRSLRQARTEASQIRTDYAKSLSSFKLAIEIEE